MCKVVIRLYSVCIVCVCVCDAKAPWCKKVQPSKVESYLEVNAQTDWQQEHLVSEYSAGA